MSKGPLGHGRGAAMDKVTIGITVKSIGIAVIAVIPVLGQSGTALSAERIRDQDRFLSSDLLEGRGVGTRGGELATEYIANQLAIAGTKPIGPDGSYFQPVPLVGI